MVTVRWEPVVIDTSAWIFGVRSFLEEVETALPEAESKSRHTLKQLAEQQKWDESDYGLEEGELASKFKDWLPRLVGYSAITLNHTLIETQLTATSNRLRQLYRYPLKINDLRGDPVERAKTYLTKVAGIQVGSDSGWQVLQDLAELRNIIVHRRGRQGADPKDQKSVQQLTERYPDGIRLSGRRDDPDAEVEVSVAICKRFIGETERFFERLFAAMGWPSVTVIEQQTHGVIVES